LIFFMISSSLFSSLPIWSYCAPSTCFSSLISMPGVRLISLTAFQNFRLAECGTSFPKAAGDRDLDPLRNRASNTIFFTFPPPARENSSTDI
jgi:hypothetical protein